MTTEMRKLGALGEQLATEYLQELGYQILSRNWRGNRVELDIVALFESTLVFCEVKTRRSVKQGLPIEAVTNQKLQNLRKAALSWLAAHSVIHSQIRFDVIGIVAEYHLAPVIDHVKGIEI